MTVTDWVGRSMSPAEWRSHRGMTRSEWYLRKKNPRRGPLPETYGEGRHERIAPDGDRKYLAAEKRRAKAK